MLTLSHLALQTHGICIDRWGGKLQEGCLWAPRRCLPPLGLFS